MPRFDLSKYATVAERLALLEKAWPDYRIITNDYSTEQDRAKGIWRVKATLYLTREDQEAGCAKATGHAFEVDGQPGANTTSALENAETSSIGRCLGIASAAWSGNKDDATKSLASREEMLKAQRGAPIPQVQVEVPDGFADRVANADSQEDLLTLWQEAVNGGFSTSLVSLFGQRKGDLQKVEK